MRVKILMLFYIHKMIILDSCILVALIHIPDSQHEKAVELFKNLQEPICIPEYVAMETVTVLQNKKNKKAANEFLTLLSKESNLYSFLPSSPSLFQKAKKIFAEQEKNLSFVDCTLVALASEYQVITFDEALEKAIEGKIFLI